MNFAGFVSGLRASFLLCASMLAVTNRGMKPFTALADTQPKSSDIGSLIPEQSPWCYFSLFFTGT
jgi:hypothetical protein